MKNYLTRFNELHDYLHQHSGVQILSYQPFPPASTAEMQAAERLLGQALPEPMKDFYRQTNGLQLRWIFTTNEQFDEEIHQREDNMLDWQYAWNDYREEDGIIMLLPLDQLSNQVVERKDPDQKLYPIDLFHDDYDMALHPNPFGECLLYMGQDQHSDYTHSNPTDFDSYIEFLLANLGAVHRRIYFYEQAGSSQKKTISSPQAYWTKERQFLLDQILLKSHFHLSEQVGRSMYGIKSQQIWQSLASSPSIRKSELKRQIEQHQLFLQSGGAGGQWSTLLVRGLTIALYQGAEATEGEQAWLEHRRLGGQNALVDAHLPFANFVGLYAPAQHFEQADLSHSLMTDAMLDHSDFTKANLEGIDFSRSTLREVSFQGTNLRGADFENCDLTGANFSGACLQDARFPGACLANVTFELTYTATL